MSIHSAVLNGKYYSSNHQFNKPWPPFLSVPGPQNPSQFQANWQGLQPSKSLGSKASKVIEHPWYLDQSPPPPASFCKPSSLQFVVICGWFIFTTNWYMLEGRHVLFRIFLWVVVPIYSLIDIYLWHKKSWQLHIDVDANTASNKSFGPTMGQLPTGNRNVWNHQRMFAGDLFFLPVWRSVVRTSPKFQF